MCFLSCFLHKQKTSRPPGRDRASCAAYGTPLKKARCRAAAQKGHRARGFHKGGSPDVHFCCLFVHPKRRPLICSNPAGYAIIAKKEKSVCMIYAVEAIEDVIWGYYQQRNRLDLGARLFCIRWIGILIVFPIALYINKNLYRTMLLCFLVSLFLFAILLKLTYPCVCTPADRKVSIVIRRDDLNKISVLLKTAFPLCVIAVLSFFVNNAPKYAIDACLTDEIQACFGFVAMPVFVIRLLNNFIYQPLLVPMAMEWDQRKIKSFIRRIIQQTIMIIGISTVCLIGAYFLGIPVLSWLYSTDLSEYKEELMILLLGSGFMAESGYQSVVLTVMRCQKDLLWPYCLTAFIAVISLWRIVPIYGTLGAAVCYLTLMLLLCSLHSGILIKKICNFK